MQHRFDSGLVRTAGITKQLRLLTSVGATETDFLSLYMDTASGVQACRDLLYCAADDLRQSMSEDAVDVLHKAVAKADAELLKGWSEETRGLAIFIRAADNEFCRVLKFALPFENRLRFYRVPVLDPLLQMAQAERPFLLTLARKGILQVIDVDLGAVRPRALATLKYTDPKGNGAAGKAFGRWGRKRVIASLGRPLQLVRRVFAGASPAAVVLAGEMDILNDIRSWLPRRYGKRLCDVISVPAHLDQRDATDFVRARMADLVRIDSADVAARLVRAAHIPSRAALGRLASLTALRSGNAETLVIEQKSPPEDDWICLSCDTASSFSRLPGACPNCSAGTVVEWDSVVELSHMAYRQGARIVIADSEELRSLGGVGCLLRQPGESNVMPLPLGPRQLDLVA